MATVKDLIGGGKSVSASKEEARPKRKKLKHMRLSRAENGGFLAEHEHVQPEGMGGYEQPTEHVFGPKDGHALIKHVAKHMRIPLAGLMAGGDDNEPVLGKAAPRAAAPKPRPTPMPAETEPDGDEGEE